MVSHLTTASAIRPVAARRGALAREQTLWAYIFLLPWIIGLVVFILGPILFSLGLSFFTYTLGRDATFVGLDNWIRAFTQDELFWPTILRTFVYTACVVPLSVFGALMTAMLLNQKLRGTTFYRTVFFMPHLAPVVAAIYIWLWLLNPQYGLLKRNHLADWFAPHRHRLQRTGLVRRSRLGDARVDGCRVVGRHRRQHDGDLPGRLAGHS